MSSIGVVGTGEVQVKPDLAQVSVGVLTQSKSAADAMKENSQKMAQLLEVLKRRAILEKDIQTTNINVSPRYEAERPGQNTQRINGYQVSNVARIKVRQLSALGSLLDDLMQGGANQVYGISFSLSDPANALDDARKKAIADARRKAELYAEAAGVQAGQAIMIQEQNIRGPQPMFFDARAAMPTAAAVPVSPGEQTLTAEVAVTYRLLDAKGKRADAKKADEKNVDEKNVDQ